MSDRHRRLAFTEDGFGMSTHLATEWNPVQRVAAAKTVTVGVFPGEGIGPEIVAITERVLRLLESRGLFEVRLSHGGLIGMEARNACGADLPDEAVQFAEDVFSAGGAILAGAGGGRFVYDMRRKFDLFLKLNPLRRLRGAVPARREFDILVVRDNREGLYQGDSTVEMSAGDQRVSHTFYSSSRAVDDVTDRAARLAVTRRGHLTVVAKESGIPAISKLWRDSGEAAGARHGVTVKFLEMDYAVYLLMRDPAMFDVIAVPNCFGDILSDLGGVLMGSRGATFGGSYDLSGRAVYQTNHGAAYDLKGAGTANPAGQILSLAMMLRESFGHGQVATLIESAVEDAWSAGWCTFDMEEIHGQPRRVCGTQVFAAEVEKNLMARMDRT
ncbi:MAG: 3-isopropylmalate dehydrogenase [Opitutaceae bacterium]|nr:3-isopropylmalate dehydrogenase [Opitutaceae bacterium]